MKVIKRNKIIPLHFWIFGLTVLGHHRHVQLLEKLRLSAFAGTRRFQTILSLEFQEMWQKK